MYIVSTRSTFDEISFDEVNISNNIESAFSQVKEKIVEVCNSTNDIVQKRYCITLLNDIGKSKESSGYGTINMIGYDIVEDKEFSQFKKKEKEKLEKEIKILENKVQLYEMRLGLKKKELGHT